MTELLKVIEWMNGRDTGMSSKAIAAHMVGSECDGSYPYDPADLGRCLRLLELFPEWKPRISEMGKYSPEWKRLANRWGEVSAFMAEEVGIDWGKGKSAPITYNLMKEVLGR